MPWVAANGVDLGDLGPTRTNEDDFDAHLTAAAILRCVLEGTPVTRSEWIDAEAEGSMLLAGPLISTRRGEPALTGSWKCPRDARPCAFHCWCRNAWCVRRMPATPTSTHAVQQRGVSLSRFGMYDSVSGLNEVDGMRTSLRPACILSGTRMSRIAGNERASSGSSTPTGS